MKKITFANGTEFTVEKPSLKDFMRLFDLWEQRKSTSSLFDEVLKYVTYPSKEDARKFLTKYLGSLYPLCTSIFRSCGTELADTCLVEELDDDKIKFIVDNEVFCFRRPNFVEMDLLINELNKSDVISAEMCNKLLHMTLVKSNADAKSQLANFLEQYPFMVVHIGRQIFTKCMISAEFIAGE